MCPSRKLLGQVVWQKGVGEGGGLGRLKMKMGKAGRLGAWGTRGSGHSFLFSKELFVSGPEYQYFLDGGLFSDMVLRFDDVAGPALIHAAK